ncbi:MAG: siphovirus ReqiPepy6 Gp37-like family protein, partial [Pseudoramibacter sp.]
MERPVLRVYEIADHKLQMIGYINDTKSVIWKRGWSTYGDFEIHLTQPNDLLKRDRWIMLNDDPDKFGIIKKVVDDSDGRLWNSTQDFTVYGFEASYILNKRITIPDDNANKNHDGYLTWNKQPAEAIMYDLVKTQITAPADSKRKIEEITIKSHDTPSGHETAFKSRFKAITTDLQTLSEYSGLGYRVTPDFDTGKLVFEVLHGVDRTQEIETIENGVITGATVNPNAYVFSQDNKRVKKHTYTHDSSAYKTMAYVAGEGDGADRKIVKISDDLTGLERDEVLIDARDIQSSHTEVKVNDGTLSSDSSTTTTTTSGDEKLTEEQLISRGTEKLQSAYRDVVNYEYESDVSDYGDYYDLGDTTTYVDRKNGIRLDQQITAVEETYENGIVTVTPTFGYTENTVSTQIQATQSAQLVERTGISKQFDKIQANLISTAELFAKHAYIMGLDVDDATVKRLEADMADFKTLTAQRTSTQNLIANEASITALSAEKADIEELTADKANIKDLTAKKG